LALGLTPQRPVTCEVGRPAEEPQRPTSVTVADEKDDENSLGKVKIIFQLQLLSSWGDEFYIGLNGIELYDRRHERIKVRAHNLAAFPESVNILPAVDGDPRTSLNLINGCNDTDRAEQMWLTPMLPNRCARVFFVFDVPVAVSTFVIYNYRKTPARGVRHISVSVDDLIVYSGDVPESTTEKTGILEINFRE
ncbi:hypothetical protein TELCIR_12844, partial [Teladorsagia circumcincta]